MKQFILLIFATCIILPSFADTTYVYQLPFEEKFTTGVFTTNEWTVEGVNWQVNGQEGNPLPSAMFAYAPADTNYSKSLISPPVNGTGFISGKIFLNYDILLDDGIASGQEKLSAEVFDGSQWVTVYSDSSVGDFNWKRNHVDITEAAKGDTFQVRFRAYGVNTSDINKWLIDNINIYRFCEAPTNLHVSMPDPANQECMLLLEWEPPIEAPIQDSIRNYNIYKDGHWLTSTNELMYFDTVQGTQTYCYTVSALYEDCESEFSNVDCEFGCVVGTSFNEVSKINIHPNPAVTYINFDLNYSIRQISIYDLIGNKIESIEIIKDQMTYRQGLNNYNNGVYLVKFISSSGESLTKKMIVTK